VGHFAVQIAKISGAAVTAVCSGANTDFVRGLGADRTIDYASEAFTKGAERYDIIFDAVSKSTFGECKLVLTPTGVYVQHAPGLFGPPEPIRYRLFDRAEGGICHGQAQYGRYGSG